MITTKSDFLVLYRHGLLGNTLRQWGSLEAIEQSGYRGTLSLRDGRPDSNLSRYRVPYAGARQAIAEMHGEGARGVHFNESAPDDRLLFQGEFLDGIHPRNPAGNLHNKYLMWSTEKVPMKRVQQWTHTEGVRSLLLLRGALSPDAWDEFQDLQDRFPEHTIEFSVYDCFLGTLPGRNWVVWELRGTY